jgi:hypothetical protein
LINSGSVCLQTLWLMRAYSCTEDVRPPFSSSDAVARHRDGDSIVGVSVKIPGVAIEGGIVEVGLQHATAAAKALALRGL